MNSTKKLLCSLPDLLLGNVLITLLCKLPDHLLGERDSDAIVTLT